MVRNEVQLRNNFKEGQRMLFLIYLNYFFIDGEK